MDLFQEQKADVVIYLFRFYHPQALFDILTAQSIFLLLPKHALYGNRWWSITKVIVSQQVWSGPRTQRVHVFYSWATASKCERGENLLDQSPVSWWHRSLWGCLWTYNLPVLLECLKLQLRVVATGEVLWLQWHNWILQLLGIQRQIITNQAKLSPKTTFSLMFRMPADILAKPALRLCASGGTGPGWCYVLTSELSSKMKIFSNSQMGKSSPASLLAAFRIK